MKTLFLAALLLAPAARADAPAPQQRYVSAWVRGSLRDRWDISDGQGRIWLSVSAFGNSINFNGRPVSGSLYGSGNYYSISAGSLSGSINAFGSSLDVRANAFGPQGTRWLNFTLYVNGPTNDPNRAPSLSLYSGDASLTFSPSFSRDYNVSGWVDEARFGDEGLALACLAATVVLKGRPQAAAVPGPGFLQKSAVLAPFLKAGFGR